VSAPEFELPLVQLPFEVQPLDTPPPTQEELLAEYGEWWREQEAAKLELNSVFLNVMPGSGEIKGLVEAFAGEDLVTGERLSWWERVLSGVSAIPLIHEGAVLTKLIKEEGALAKVAHQAHTVHKFNKVLHASHAIHPIDVLVVEPVRKQMDGHGQSGGEH
jgi:hypothetical protein